MMVVIGSLHQLLSDDFYPCLADFSPFFYGEGRLMMDFSFFAADAKPVSVSLNLFFAAFGLFFPAWVGASFGLCGGNTGPDAP